MILSSWLLIFCANIFVALVSGKRHSPQFYVQSIKRIHCDFELAKVDRRCDLAFEEVDHNADLLYRKAQMFCYQAFLNLDKICKGNDNFYCTNEYAIRSKNCKLRFKELGVFLRMKYALLDKSCDDAYADYDHFCEPNKIQAPRPKPPALAKIMKLATPAKTGPKLANLTPVKGPAIMQEITAARLQESQKIKDKVAARLAKLAAKEKARRDAIEKLKREKEERLKKIAALKAKKEAELKAKKEAELKAKKEAELAAARAKLAAEKAAKLAAARAAKQKAERAAELEAERAAKLASERASRRRDDKDNDEILQSLQQQLDKV